MSALGLNYGSRSGGAGAFPPGQCAGTALGALGAVVRAPHLPLGGWRGRGERVNHSSQSPPRRAPAQVRGRPVRRVRLCRARARAPARGGRTGRRARCPRALPTCEAPQVPRRLEREQPAGRASASAAPSPGLGLWRDSGQGREDTPLLQARWEYPGSPERRRLAIWRQAPSPGWP